MLFAVLVWPTTLAKLAALPPRNCEVTDVGVGTKVISDECVCTSACLILVYRSTGVHVWAFSWTWQLSIHDG